MKSLSELFSSFPQSVKQRFLPQACDLQNKLELGESYVRLGGVQLKACHQLVRFKLGHYRLIFEKTDTGLEPVCLISRKNLETWLKRRCNSKVAN